MRRSALCAVFMVCLFVGCTTSPNGPESRNPMAGTWTDAHEDYAISFDQNTGEYTVTEGHHVAGAASLEAEIGLDALPHYGDIVHVGYDIDGTMRTQTVRCWLGTKALHAVGVGDTSLEGTATYHGRLKGILTITPQIQIISEALLFDLSPTATNKKGIGMSLEGAPRELPVLMQEVEECISLEAIDTRRSKSALVAGTVNESSWVAPWTVPGREQDSPILKGSYLYLGITRTITDRRSHSAILTHSFVQRLDWADQSIYVWIQGERKQNTVTKHWEVLGATPVSSKIYYVAGASGAPDNGDGVVGNQGFKSIFTGFGCDLTVAPATIRPIF